MSNKRTPWSQLRHRAGLSAEQFGSVDSEVIRAATRREPRDRSAVAGPLGSVRLLGSAARDSGLGNGMWIEDVASESEDDPSEYPPGRVQAPTSSESPPVPGRPEPDPEGHKYSNLSAGSALQGYRPAEPTVDDSRRRWVVPDPPPVHTTRTPVSPAASAQGAHHAVPPPPSEHAYPADTVLETETPGLLPVGGHALIGLCLGMAVLLAVGFFYLGRAADPDPAATPTAAIAASTTAPRKTAAAKPPDIGVGFVWGKVLTNDGTTLTVHSEISHSEVVVRTDDHTKIYVLIATTIEAIAEGAPIIVYGRKHADGAIFAETITGVSLRALGTR